MKIKILYVHHSGSFGGAPKSLSYLLRNIDRYEYDVKLINISKGPINDFFKSLSVNMEIVDGIKPFHGSTVASKSLKLFIKNIVFFIPSMINSYFLIKRERPDIIHLNSTCLFVFAIASRFIKLKPKVVCHVREPLRKSISGKIISFFTTNFVDGLIAISLFDLNSLGYKKNNIETLVVHNFVDLNDVPKIRVKKFNLHKKLNIEIESVVFLYLARFASSNGWIELIEMAKKVSSKNINFHFVLVGAKKEFELNYSDHNNIHILPFQQDVKSLLLDSDVFVCPFIEPHFSRGVIEASYAGLPVLVSNVGSVNELLIHEETGYLYNNFQEFEYYVEELGKSEKKRNEMGIRAKVFAEENFNLKKQCGKTFDFYKRILNIKK